MRLGIIGGGRAAWAFGSSWKRAGLPLSGMTLRPGSKSPAPELLSVERIPMSVLLTRSDILLAAVSDSALGEVAAQIADAPADVAIFHCSGSLTSAVFERPNGFSLHPLRALPAVGKESSLEDVLLVFEGPPAALPIAQKVASSTGARLATVPAAQKPLYHAAAVFASNYVAALLNIAEELAENANVRLVRPDGSTSATRELRDSLVQLAVSAAENWRLNEGQRAFTGPVVRGERAVVLRHLEALTGDPQLLAIYRDLAGRIAHAIAGRTGAASGDALARWLDGTNPIP
jgi:predicted short-subunit dehydrogenase-like oxidoreductase (DUF2520 family)